MGNAFALGPTNRRGLARGLNEFRAQSQALSGQLRLSVPTIMATPFFAQVIGAFQDLHPALTMDIHLDDHISDPIDQQVDLTIRIGDPGNDPRPAQRLLQIAGHIYVAPAMAHRLQTPQDLITMRWLQTPAMSQTLCLHHKSGGQTFIEPEQRLTANNGQFIMHLLAAQAGWAVFPEFAVGPALQSGKLALVLPDWSISQVDVFCPLFCAASILKQCP